MKFCGGFVEGHYICHYYCGLSSQRYTAGKDFNEHLLKHKKLQFNPTDSETAIMDRFAIPTLHCILGPCNKICDVLEEKWPGFLDWCKAKGINLVKAHIIIRITMVTTATSC